MVVEMDEYLFAEEYDGPPISGELPKAVPILVDRIPMASVVSPNPFSDRFSLPVVQPISASDVVSGKKVVRDLKLDSDLVTVSPTSVIAFESRNNDVSEGSFSKELGLGNETETTVSPNSVINQEMVPEKFHDSSNCGLSGELSSDLECCNNLGCGESGVTEVGEHSCEFVDGNLGVSNRFEKSGEFSSGGFNNERNGVDWESSESILSMDYPSSRVSSRNYGDRNNESVSDARRGPVVTFCDIESDDGDNNEEYSRYETEIVRAKKEIAINVKKGTCYRCFKGNRFTEKEVCMVCDAKYCTNCVLRAMGSMPEGRKCVSCIGFPIDESKRANLGKCSRMLKRLLNDLEVRQIMKTEKLCEVNQMPHEYICVNGRSLYHEELIVLQSCSNPPKKLKPGAYWYDKVSGLWGKEGQKPSQIISPHLNVGGSIKADASNGNTQVYINGREITKKELRMLKLAGVQCAGNPHFWVNEDGSYQEEGQKNTKGYIWGKAGTKLLCALLSLPVPSKSPYPCGEQVTSMTSRSMPDYLEQRGLLKLLLIGYTGSGTSTIFKQAKILYKDVPFSDEEREHIKLVIQSNVYSYIGMLLEGRERFEEESLYELGNDLPGHGAALEGNVDGDVETTLYSICPRLKSFSDWLLKTMASGNLEAIFPAASREYAPVVEELWGNVAFQATYQRRAELEALPSIASYFLERAVEILKPDYIPSDVDILYAEHVNSSNGLSCVDFSFPESTYDDETNSGDLHDSLLRFQLIRLQAKNFGENCKWLQMLEEARLVIFCVSLADYDQFDTDNNGNSVNRMLACKKFFETMVTHPSFEQTEFLLLLNKFDIFEEKIEQVPLTRCDWFEDFQPVVSRNRSNNNPNHPTMGQLGFHYVAVKFKRLYSALTGRKLYTLMVKGLEPASVDAALKYGKEILNWEEEKQNYSLNEYSFYSNEASSSSA